MTDYEQLLEDIRHGAKKEEFAQYMPELCKPESFSDPTKIRLLGNCIAECPANADILRCSTNGIKELLKIQPLGLKVLYNGTVRNPEFSSAVISNTEFLAEAKPTPEFKELLGSIWESLNGDISKDLKIMLVLRGFVEILIFDESLETEPEIVANFTRIFAMCQNSSNTDGPNNGEYDDIDEEAFGLSIKVVGRISSHTHFSPQDAAGIELLPYTWETVAVLVNITANVQDMEETLPKFPDIVPLTMKLIREEGGDESDDEIDENNMDYEDMPFDLELWGNLFRNLARDPVKAAEICQYNPIKLIKTLLSNPYSEKIGLQFSGSLAKIVYNHDIAEKFTELPVDEAKFDIACSISNYVCQSQQELAKVGDGKETEYIVPRLVKIISEALLIDPREPSWVRGTRSLAVLQVAYPNSSAVSADDMARLKSSAPNTQAVKQNLENVK